MNVTLKDIFSYHDWRQKIKLGNNIYTPGHIKKDIWKWALLPDCIEGSSFADIGSNDGMVAFEALERGAEKILACDLYIDKLDTMAKGWPITGLELLIQWFNTDKVLIERKGLKGLEENIESYDHVVVSDVINWLGNIDETLDIIASISQKYIYISDQFLKSPKAVKMKHENENLHVFNEMCSLQYLVKRLKGKGFRVVKSKLNNPYEMDDSSFQGNYLLTTSTSVPVYENPFEKSKQIGLWSGNVKSSFEYNEYFFIRRKGWLKKEDVKVKEFKDSLFLKLSKIFKLVKFYYKIKFILSPKLTENYSIKLEKIT